jgi:putative drug exporter of the RND superfamily
MRTSHDVLAVLPQDAESVRGLHALEQHLPAGETSPLLVVVEGGSSVYDPAAFRALGDLSRNLQRLPNVASVRSAAMPLGGARPDLAEDVEADVTALAEGMHEAAAGARRLQQGIVEVRDGVAEIDARLPELVSGLGEARDGAAGLLAGIDEARAGTAELRGGLSRLRSGVSEARTGAEQLRVDVAEPTAAALERAIDALRSFTVGRADPFYDDAFEEAGEAYARVTGRYPPGHPQAGQQVDPGYEGLPASLAELSSGLGQVIDGLDHLDAGLGELEAGLTELAAGLRQLHAGLGQAQDGGRALQDGIRRLLAGIDGELLPGAGELADRLTEGAVAVEEAGLGELALAPTEGPFVLTAGMLEAMPDVRERLTFFVTGDETRTRIFIGLEQPAFSEASIAAVPEIQRTARTSLLDSPLEEADVFVTGSAAFLDEVDQAVTRDFPIIVAAVIAGVFTVLGLLLRSVVAPVYMVTTVLLTYASALGVATIVFQGILGHPGLQWWIPSLLFVLLVALGVDYNIFLMGRVREEAGRLVTRDAVAEGIRRTGRVITSAGVILAATFGGLVAAPLRSVAQMGFAAMVGILLDTFVVRAAVVPSIAVLLGRHSWWPSSRAAAD